MELFARNHINEESPQITSQDVLNKIKKENEEQKEYLQAIDEVLEHLDPLFKANPAYVKALEFALEPERIVMFRVPWIDDHGVLRINRGYRIQHSNVLGPYKGGLRFHPSVNLSILKALAFEQTLKNALTGLSMGGAKGGSDFDPKGKSDSEVRSFCQSFMTELYQHLGACRDVPAGDIGVGEREISFLFGMFKKLSRSFEGVLTGKEICMGGSQMRREATGYGAVYFAARVLRDRNDSLIGKKCIVTGAGNAAQYVAEKLIHSGAIVLSLSDSDGCLIEPNGITMEQLTNIKELKTIHRKRISEFTMVSPEGVLQPGTPWHLKCDMAFPSATQNEVTEEVAHALVSNESFKYLFEVSNMSSSIRAIQILKQKNVIVGPSKAVNAGGVAVSGLEMAQNSSRQVWSREEVDNKLKDIMSSIYDQCVAGATMINSDPFDIQAGANAAAFVKVIESTIRQGAF